MIAHFLSRHSLFSLFIQTLILQLSLVLKYTFILLLLTCSGFRYISPEHLRLQQLTLLANSSGYVGFDSKMKTLGYTVDSKNENDNYTTFTSYIYTNKNKSTVGSITLKDYADGKPLVVYSTTKNLKDMYRFEMLKLAFVPEKKQNTTEENLEDLLAFENKFYHLHYSFSVTQIGENSSDTSYSAIIWKK